MRQGYKAALVNDGNGDFTQYRCAMPHCAWIGDRFDHEGNPNAVNEALQQGHDHSIAMHPVTLPDADPLDDWERG